MTKGVYFSANDHVYSWTLALLRSFRKYNPDLQMYWIPFNEDSEKIEGLAEEFSFKTFIDPSFAELEKLGKAYELGYSQNGRYWFRRYAAFWGPLDYFIYLDARKVILDDLSHVLELLMGENYDFLYHDLAPDQVYEPGPLRRKFISDKGARSFLSGFWASRNQLFSREELLTLGNESLKHRDQLNPRNTDQAFINYCVDSRPELKTGHIAELLGGYIHQGWAGQRGKVYQKQQNYYLWDYGGLDHKKKILLLHWAGYHWNDHLPQSHILNKFSGPTIITRFKRLISSCKRLIKSRLWLRKWMGDV